MELSLIVVVVVLLFGGGGIALAQTSAGHFRGTDPAFAPISFGKWQVDRLSTTADFGVEASNHDHTLKENHATIALRKKGLIRSVGPV
jgi:hypothetical protein